MLPPLYLKIAAKRVFHEIFGSFFYMYGMVQVCIRTFDDFIFPVAPSTSYLNLKLDAINAKSTQLNNVKPHFFVILYTKYTPIVIDQ